jgi:small subunit ribosomal protein S16
MVKIRLRRTGAKKQPSYRIVIADSDSPRDGRFIEVIGNYNPRTEPATVNLQEDRALYWLSVGAQMTATVARLLKNAGTLERFAQVKQGVATEAAVSG